MDPISELDQSLTLSEFEAGHGADISLNYTMDSSMDMDINATNTSMCTIDLQQDDQCSESDTIRDTHILPRQQSRIRGISNHSVITHMFMQAYIMHAHI